MAIAIHTLEERPDLRGTVWELSPLWPPFMHQDPLADLYFARLDAYARHALLAVDAGRVVARAFAVPFAMGGADRPRLPDDGWDGVVRWAWLDALARREPTHVSALEISVRPALRGTGLAERMLEALKATARPVVEGVLVAPVRPSRKHHEPHTDMASYVRRTRSDGRPHDPWLRLHEAAGGLIERVCPRSMTISGTLAEWRRWTGAPFDRDGPTEVADALVPVHVDVAQDHAVYVEPNVWVVHDGR